MATVYKDNDDCTVERYEISPEDMVELLQLTWGAPRLRIVLERAAVFVTESEDGGQYYLDERLAREHMLEIMK